MVLHQLCDRLNRLGYSACLWPIFKPVFDWNSPVKSLSLSFRYLRKTFKYGYGLNPKLLTPMIEDTNLDDTIVIYPEIIVGNPLKAQRVVRWLLHKPGYNNGGKIDFGQKDLFFFYEKAFDDPRFNPFPDNLLHIVSQRKDTYHLTNTQKRKGSCYLLRKGNKRPLVHDTSGSILVDHLSHEEMAKVFNQCEICVIYDTYTMFSVYAAMCGCIPVIIPEEGVSIDEWQPVEENRYGMAYGFDGIEYAKQTRDLLLAKLERQEEESNASVHRFVQKCQEYWKIKN